jgi:hypothetical protein
MSPVGVIHDVMTLAKWGRQTTGMFKLSRSLSTLNASRSKLFVAMVQHFLFRHGHDRFSCSDFTASGNWDIFLNIINVEAQHGLTEAHLVKTLYGLVAVRCRSFDCMMCSKGDEPWAQAGQMTFARMRCGSRSPAGFRGIRLRTIWGLGCRP